jgi:hypothetical protein
MMVKTEILGAADNPTPVVQPIASNFTDLLNAVCIFRDCELVKKDSAPWS